jgi:hypothetical protein
MRGLSRRSVTLFALASCGASASLSAQPERPRFELEPVFAVQLTTSAPPPSEVGVLDPAWDTGIARFGVQIAVRPFRRLSRWRAEAVLTGEPQPGGDLVVRVRVPITGDAVVTGTASNAHR